MAMETELKFRVPALRLAALRRAVATATAQVVPLAAAYFDTPGQHLAQARIALRLRCEGGVWVQTLKAEGAGALQRLEDNQPVPGAARPLLDIGRHHGSAAAAALRQCLAQAGSAVVLEERYATAVQRTQRLLRSGGALIELALDEGEISAGDRRLAICEIEFELKQGPPQALLAVAARWAARFGLVLDLRSKSELGHNLAAGLAGSAPTKARPLQLARHAPLAEVRAAMLGNTLHQVLANASQMAAGPSAPEHLHQLRVGLRRLRSVAGLAWPDWQADIEAAQALATLFGQLGAARDQDAMAAWLWPALRAAGAPLAEMPPAALASTEVQMADVPMADVPMADARSADARTAAAPAASDPATLLRSTATQQLWLLWLGLSLPASTPPPAAPATAATPPAAASAAKQLARPMRRLLRQVRRDGRNFADLDDPARHRLRRRIKRLRYLAELGATLWPAKPVARLLKALALAQQPLGEFNDTVVALAHCRALAVQDPRAWFAVGWLAARRTTQLPLCAAVLDRLAKRPSPW